MTANGRHQPLACFAFWQPWASLIAYGVKRFATHPGALGWLDAAAAAGETVAIYALDDAVRWAEACGGTEDGPPPAAGHRALAAAWKNATCPDHDTGRDTALGVDLSAFPRGRVVALARFGAGVGWDEPGWDEVRPAAGSVEALLGWWHAGCRAWPVAGLVRLDPPAAAQPIVDDRGKGCRLILPAGDAARVRAAAEAALGTVGETVGETVGKTVGKTVGGAAP
jgi:hypothetical protein